MPAIRDLMVKRPKQTLCSNGSCRDKGKIHSFGLQLLVGIENSRDQATGVRGLVEVFTYPSVKPKVVYTETFIDK